jgi:hypothetical protein
MGVQHVQAALGPPGAYAPGGSSTGSWRRQHPPTLISPGPIEGVSRQLARENTF